MKTFAVNRLAVAAAVLASSVTSFAQTPTNQLNIPNVPNISLDFATLAAQQSQMVSDLLTKLHEQASTAARSVLGMVADTMNPDELEAALAERIPGFAGWIHREDGTSVMRMAGIKAADAATVLLRSPNAAAFAAATGSKVSVQAALWDSRQLLNFKEKAFGLASTKGVITTWINRETNRVEISYNSDLDAAKVDALADQLVAAGIPRSAMVLTPGEIAIAGSATGVSLQKQLLPLAGGSQIPVALYGSGNTVDIVYCTLGVPAVRGGVRGFVTSSHCSDSTFGIGQPSRYGDSTDITYIADETVDPKGSACPSALSDSVVGCRKSDALFAAARVSNAVDFGRVLMTPGANNLTVSKILNIKGTQNFPTVGQTVYKTGRTTGTTSAKVARVCVDTLVGDLKGKFYGLLCSSEVDSAGFFAAGDSGAPVWLSSNGAIIAGLMSYYFGTGNPRRGFSPWGAVVKELGSLTVK